MMELVPASATDANADIQPAVASGDLWRPVISELQALGEEHTQGDMSWIYIFVTGFLVDCWLCSLLVCGLLSR